MDDEGRPVKFWARLLFQPRPHSEIEFRLGLVVVGIALLFAWLILWTFIPTLIVNIFIGIGSVISWFFGLFSGGGGNEVATPEAIQQVLTPGPSPSPSPFPSPSPSPFPR